MPRTNRNALVVGSALAMLGAASAFAGGPSGEKVFAIAATADGQSLVSFFTNAPAAATLVAPISGLQPGETLLGLDYRPADTKLYGVGSSSRLYQVDRHSGVATSVSASPFSTALSGAQFGFDFNPQIDRIRNVSDADQNLVLNPNTGALQLAATPVFYGGANTDPNVVHHAYDNNFPGTTATQLRAIDTELDQLVKQANNAGTLTVVGPLGVNFAEAGGFDVSRASNLGYAVSTDQSGMVAIASLYLIDLNTGAAAGLGPVTTAAGADLDIVAMTIYTPPPCLADLNSDNVVDGIDLGLFLSFWNTGDDRADLDDDGISNGSDWGLVMAGWGPCD